MEITCLNSCCCKQIHFSVLARLHIHMTLWRDKQTTFELNGNVNRKNHWNISKPESSLSHFWLLSITFLISFSTHTHMKPRTPMLFQHSVLAIIRFVFYYCSWRSHFSSHFETYAFTTIYFFIRFSLSKIFLP